MPEIPMSGVSLLEMPQVFMLGLLYGATICTITCLPYVGPYILTTGRGFRDGVHSSMLFLSGKLLTYAVMGGVAGYVGGSFISGDVGVLKYIVGTLLVLAGLMLPFSNSKDGCGTNRRKDGSLLTLGVASSLIPCPALATVLLLAAKQGTLLSGASYGIAYGTGVAISPLLIVGGGLSVISGGLKEKIGSFVPYLQILAAIFIIAQGIKIMMEV